MIAEKENPRRETGEVEVEAHRGYPVERSPASISADARRRDKVRRRIFADVPPEFSDYGRFAPGKSVQDVRFAFQRAAIRDERLGPWERLTLVFIVERFLVADRRAVVSDRMIREALGISVRSIARVRAKLEALGLVWVRGGTGKGDPLVYHLRVEGLFVAGTDANHGVPQTPSMASSTTDYTTEKGYLGEITSSSFVVEGVTDRRPSEALEAIANEIETAPTVCEASARFVALTPSIFDLIRPRKLTSATVQDRLVRAVQLARERPPGTGDPGAAARLAWLPYQFSALKREV